MTPSPVASPKPPQPSPAAQPAVSLGILLMVVAMAVIPSVDGIAKVLSADHSPLFISLMRYAVASTLIIPIAVIRFGRHFLPRNHRRDHFLRAVFLTAAMTSYFYAIAVMPLAVASSAFFVGPIVATVLAVVILGEKFTWHKGIAVLLGFAGAMLILQPGKGAIEPGLGFAFAAGIFFAFYMISTRRAAQQSDPLKTLVFQCLVMAALLSPALIWTAAPITLPQAGLFTAMGIISLAAHLLSITAFRYAEASVLAPIVYVELLSSAVIGAVFFGHFPAATIWLGAAVIVIGGLLSLKRS